jgi:hypothetical protein
VYMGHMEPATGRGEARQFRGAQWLAQCVVCGKEVLATDGLSRERPSNVIERPSHASEASDLASRAPSSRCAAGPESAAKIKGAGEEATAVYTASWTGPPLKRSGGGAMAPVCLSRFYF